MENRTHAFELDDSRNGVHVPRVSSERICGRSPSEPIDQEIPSCEQLFQIVTSVGIGERRVLVSLPDVYD